MRSIIKSAAVAIFVLAAGIIASPGRLEAFPSFSIGPGGPGAGVLTPGGVLNPAAGAPVVGPQPPPIIALAETSLGVPAGGNLDGMSYGDDALLLAGIGAGAFSLQFSVSNAAAGGPWLPGLPAQNVFTQGVGGEGAAGTDIFATPPGVTPPFAPLACGLGGNAQLYDGNGMNVVAPLPLSLGGITDPPMLAPFDELDAYERLGAGAVDYQTLLAAPLSGPDGRPDGPIFFTVDPATAGLMGVGPADILVTDVGSPAGFSVYATGAMLGLLAGDNIDALLVGDSAAFGPGPGGAGLPARAYGAPTDFVAFSLSPGSPSLAPAAPLPAVCAPGIKTAGDIWGVSPFFGGAPFPLYSAEGLGLCSIRVACPANDNVDAMDIAWAADADADNAPDPLEAACGAAIGPGDTDGDGLVDSIEMTLTTNPGGLCTGFVPLAPPPGAAGIPDSDFDGMIDSWEIAYWTTTCPATNPSIVDPATDLDGDGATNIVEYLQNTSPCDADTDGDGFGDLTPAAHTGPSNPAVALDNCPNVANPLQTNSDGNFTDQSPPKAFDDLTWPNSDAQGDACDIDDDNDGLSDALEALTCAGSTGPTSPTNRDTDGDRILDRAECVFGTNATVINAAPAACLAAGDADADFVLDSRELCFYGTSNGSANTDGDGCGDAREIASINADLTVSSIDLSQVAQSFGPYVLPALPHLINFDITKDGTISATDLSQVAQRFGACP